MAVPRALDRIPGRTLAWRRPGVAAALWTALVLCTMASVQFGAVPVLARDWWAPLAEGPMPGSAHVLWQLRLPRVALAMSVGAALGLAGALSQALFRNPLADPGLLGVTSGAACAVALTLTVLSASHGVWPDAWRLWVVPAAAFAGALVACFALDRMARWLTPGSVAGLLLTGLALNAVAMAVVGLCTYVATDEQLRGLSFWTLGSLAGAGWLIAGVMAAALGGAALCSRSLAPTLNALSLGEAVATHVGVDVQRLRSHIVALVALLCALAVAWCGVIGFIGLMAPHLVRRAAGPDQRRVLPLSMLAGALLLLVADTVARSIAVPAEIPVGIFTALIGGPVFLLMLRDVARSHGAGA